MLILLSSGWFVCVGLGGGGVGEQQPRADVAAAVFAACEGGLFAHQPRRSTPGTPQVLCVTVNLALRLFVSSSVDVRDSFLIWLGLVRVRIVLGSL